MSDQNFPIYTKEKHKGNIGEAIAQYYLSKFCLVHKIDGSNDLGNDFICELVRDQAPTNLLFYVQVKFTKAKPSPSKATIKYWSASPIPVYIIWIKEVILKSSQNNDRKISYLRMTPILHNPNKHKSESYKPYHQDAFIRDLIVDYTRTQYVKGFTPLIKSTEYLAMTAKSLPGIGNYLLYVNDVIPEYREKILEQSWIQNYVIAELLYLKGGAENYKLALQAIDLSLSLISYKDRYDLAIYYQNILKLKEFIQAKLKQNYDAY